MGKSLPAAGIVVVVGGGYLAGRPKPSNAAQLTGELFFYRSNGSLHLLCHTRTRDPQHTNMVYFEMIIYGSIYKITYEF